MAAGDVYSDISPGVANNAFLDIQPAAGVEVVITNILCEGRFEVHMYDGVNTIVMHTDTETGGPWGINGCNFHITNANWIRVKNTDGAARDIGYMGVQTK